MKSMDMTGSELAQLEKPRFEERGPLRIAGWRGQFSGATQPQIAEQWQRFAPHLGTIPGQIGRAAYGVCIGCSGADTFDYLCGVEVADFARVSPDWARVSLPAQTYAIFAHREQVVKLRETIHAIFEQWLPQSGYELEATGPDVPDLFERYGEGFDPQSGRGDIEVWIPIKQSTE